MCVCVCVFLIVHFLRVFSPWDAFLLFYGHLEVQPGQSFQKEGLECQTQVQAMTLLRSPALGRALSYLPRVLHIPERDEGRGPREVTRPGVTAPGGVGSDSGAQAFWLWVACPCPTSPCWSPGAFGQPETVSSSPTAQRPGHAPS